MAYSQKVVERFENVLNNPKAHSVGRFDPKDPNVATGMVGAPACGDVMKLDLKFDDNDRILDVKFKTYGCGSAIASSTMFVEMLKGKTIEEAKLIKDRDIAIALELPLIKLHCSVLAEGAITKAISNWESKKATGEVMENGYQTKDIQATQNKMQEPKASGMVPPAHMEDGAIFEKDGMFFFKWKGGECGYHSHSDAEKGLLKVSGNAS
jgi:nitrogen fixation protein NifU and related proteins